MHGERFPLRHHRHEVSWPGQCTVGSLPCRNPVLSLNVDRPAELAFSKITIGLRPFNKTENYTCVYYDEIGETSWLSK